MHIFCRDTFTLTISWQIYVLVLNEIIIHFYFQYKKRQPQNGKEKLVRITTVTYAKKTTGYNELCELK